MTSTSQAFSKIHSKQVQSLPYMCLPHNSCFLLFVSFAYMYLKPSSSGSLDHEKISSVLHNIVIPMMNPLIYSLSNKDVIIPLKKNAEIKESFKLNLVSFLPLVITPRVIVYWSIYFLDSSLFCVSVCLCRIINLKRRICNLSHF